jgi:hypothetical protein
MFINISVCILTRTLLIRFPMLKMCAFRACLVGENRQHARRLVFGSFAIVVQQATKREQPLALLMHY